MESKQESQKNISGDNTLHISIILDRSGSMTPNWQKTLSVLSDFLFKQQKEFPNGTYDLTIFNDHVNCYAINMEISSFKGLSPDNISPDGLTSLYDAIIITCSKLLPEPGIRKFVVIVTDGEDNRSSEGSQKVAYDIIDKQKKNGVEFFFFGAGIDSFREAKKIGIPFATNINLEDDLPGNLGDNMRHLSDGICEMVRTKTTTKENQKLLRTYSEPVKDFRNNNIHSQMDTNFPSIQRCSAGDYGYFPPSVPCRLMRQNSIVIDVSDPLSDHTNSDGYVTLDNKR